MTPKTFDVQISNILESITDAFFALDSEWRFTYINREAERYMGVARDSAIGVSIWDIFPRRKKSPVYENYARAMYERQSVRFTSKGESRFSKWYEASIYPNPEGGISVYFHDITEQKNTEARLSDSEERFSKAFNNNPTAMAIFRLDDDVVVEANDNFLLLLELDRKEVVGKRVEELGYWADIKEREKMMRIIREKGIISNHEVNFRGKRGLMFTYLLSCSTFKIGEQDFMISSGVDITDRKRYEEILRLSEERFSKIFHASPSMISIRTTSDPVYVDVNESWLRSFGFKREEVIGKTSGELGISTDWSPVADSLKNQVPLNNEKISIRTRTGEMKTALISTEFATIDGNRCVISVMNDITYREKIEKEMHRFERLNLIGQMAAGIGHELRNPMTSVRGFLQVLQTRDECRCYKDHFQFMIDELDRANAILTEFLSIARTKPGEQKPCRIESVVDKLMPMITANALNEEKEVYFDKADTPAIFLDEKEMRQLILNLVRNGLEAMNKGGTLGIRTYFEDGEVVLAVSDQGTGIKTEDLNIMGTPFFTTKDNGTGLGLATCYSIANRNKAVLDFITGSTGTTFFVRFRGNELL